MNTIIVEVNKDYTNIKDIIKDEIDKILEIHKELGVVDESLKIGILLKNLNPDEMYDLTVCTTGYVSFKNAIDRNGDNKKKLYLLNNKYPTPLNTEYTKCFTIDGLKILQLELELFKNNMGHVNPFLIHIVRKKKQKSVEKEVIKNESGGEKQEENLNTIAKEPNPVCVITADEEYLKKTFGFDDIIIDSGMLRVPKELYDVFTSKEMEIGLDKNKKYELNMCGNNSVHVVSTKSGRIIEDEITLAGNGERQSLLLTPGIDNVMIHVIYDRNFNNEFCLMYIDIREVENTTFFSIANYTNKEFSQNANGEIIEIKENGAKQSQVQERYEFLYGRFLFDLARSIEKFILTTEIIKDVQKGIYHNEKIMSYAINKMYAFLHTNNTSFMFEALCLISTIYMDDEYMSRLKSVVRSVTYKIDKNTDKITEELINNPELYVIPRKFLKDMVITRTQGSLKYGEFNHLKISPTENIGRAIRHAVEYIHGDRSEDHLTHVAIRIFMAYDYLDRFGNVPFSDIEDKVNELIQNSK